MLTGWLIKNKIRNFNNLCICVGNQKKLYFKIDIL